MLWTILLVIVAVIAIVLVIAAMKPKDFRYQRTVTINAPASAVYPHVNDFHKWEPWSPWEKVDPNVQRTFEGPNEGTDASYAWEGNRAVGAGKMTMIENKPSEVIRYKMEFLKPFKATNEGSFTFVQNGNQTMVTQSMYCCNSLMGKVMGLFMNMDKMIGTQFEKGLVDLKTIVESQ